MTGISNCIRCGGTGIAPADKWGEIEVCDCVERRKQYDGKTPHRYVSNQGFVEACAVCGGDERNAVHTGTTIVERLRSEAEDLRRQSKRVDSAYMLSGAFRCDEAAVVIDELTEALETIVSAFGVRSEKDSELLPPEEQRFAEIADGMRVLAAARGGG